MTGGYKGVTRVTMGYNGLQGVREGYKSLKGITGFEGLQGV